MGKVHYLPGADLPAERVLTEAMTVGGAPLDTCLVIGKTQDGSLYFASTTDNAGEVQLLLGRAQYFLMREIARSHGDR